MQKGIRKDQKGFTLVELLVAVAIAAIVGGAVLGFMVIGARSFSSTSTEVNLQHEAQLAFNQLQDLLIDTTVGIEYMYGATETDETLVSSESDIPTGAAFKKLRMYNTDVIYEVVWSRAESRLYYNEYDALESTDAEGNKIVVKNGVRTEKERMADDITGFSVDLTRMESKRIVRVDVEFSRSGKIYRSSHNITLRNRLVSGNAIPSYVDPPKADLPAMIEAPDQIYLEPGESFTFTGITVKGVDDTKKPNQEVRWYMVDAPGFLYESDTGISTAGKLTVSKSQKNDFRVRVVTTDGTVSKTVTVCVIIVTDVNISFTPAASAKNELGDENPPIYSDDLAGGEEFTLQAAVAGRYLDQAKDPEGILAVAWEKTGGEEYFDIVSSTSTSCICRMKATLDFGNQISSKPIEVKATSTRSVTIPYGDGPVFGVWGGRAYKKPSDFNIVGEGTNLQRGQHQPFSVKPKDANIEFTKYMCLFHIRRIETIYKQDGTTSVNVIESYRDPTYAKIEGDHVGIVCAKEMNPNAEYTYEITLYVFEPLNSGDANRWEVFPYGGYNLSDYRYVSNTVVTNLKRVFLYFNNYSESKDSATNASIETGDKTAIYIPRKFGQSKTGNHDEIQQSMPFFVSNTIVPEVKSNITFDFYQESNGTWIPYEEKQYTLPEAGMITVEVGGSLVFRYHDNKWHPGMAQYLRLVPTITFDSNSYLLFDNYIEVYPWNIEAPTSKINELLGLYQKCYFPCPSDSDFPGQTSHKMTWNYPFATNVSGMESSISSIQLQYELTTQNNADGTKRWNLKLYNRNMFTNIWELLEEYYCNSDDRIWTMVK